MGLGESKERHGPKSMACLFAADAEDGCCEANADGWEED